MSTKSMKSLLGSAVRSTVMFILFGLTVKFTESLFIANLFDMTDSDVPFVHIPLFVMMLLLFEATAFVMNRHRAGLMAAYHDRQVRGSALRFLLTSTDFYVSYAVIALLSLLLPVDFAYSSLDGLLRNGGDKSDKWLVLAILLPILFALYLLAQLTALRSRHAQKGGEKAEKSELKKTAGAFLMLLLIASAVSVGLPWLLPFILTMINLPGVKTLLLYLLLFVVVGALVFFGYVYLRAYLKRKKFIAELTRLCCEKKFSLSPIKSPYRSLFVDCPGIDFTITTAKATYDCKLINGMLQGSPIIFTDTGKGQRQTSIRLFRAEIVKLLTKLDYTMPGEGKKLLIVIPVPKQIYVSEQNSRPRPADSGEIAGNYLIYNATGVLGALDRDLL